MSRGKERGGGGGHQADKPRGITRPRRPVVPRKGFGNLPTRPVGESRLRSSASHITMPWTPRALPLALLPDQRWGSGEGGEEGRVGTGAPEAFLILQQAQHTKDLDMH